MSWFSIPQILCKRIGVENRLCQFLSRQGEMILLSLGERSDKNFMIAIYSMHVFSGALAIAIILGILILEAATLSSGAEIKTYFCIQKLATLRSLSTPYFVYLLILWASYWFYYILISSSLWNLMKLLFLFPHNKLNFYKTTVKV